MAVSSWDGPLHVSGDLQRLLNPPFGSPVPEYNTDSGPSMLFQGYFYPDVRFAYLKDKVSGWPGRVPGHLADDQITTINCIPATHSATLIAAAANTVSGTAMALVTTPATGLAINIPIIPFGTAINANAPVVANQVLDFGFAWGNCTSITTGVVTVADSTLFEVGMPLVIAHVGNAAGTAALLCNVTAINSATSITVSPPPAVTNSSTPIGMGNLFGPSEVGFPVPTAHYPYMKRGPALVFDPVQGLGRGLVIVCNSASGAGGAFKISGYDIYWNPQTETITSVPASATSTYGLKAWKAITSIVPAFTDASFTYSVGTSDEIGFPLRQDVFELAEVWWNGAQIAATTGFTAPDKASPALTTSGDPRGTLLLSTIGNGSGASSNATNGTVSALAMTGRRLVIRQGMSAWQILNSRIDQTFPMYGSTPA